MTLFKEETIENKYYQELILGLNGLINKTVEIQKLDDYNSQLYRYALELQIHFEKTKLSIMKANAESLEVKLTKDNVIGIDENDKPVIEKVEVSDIRFDSELL